MGAQCKPQLVDHFTNPLPEDSERHERARDAAEAALLARQLELDATTANTSASSTAVAAARAAVSIAASTLKAASQPFKFVTNWCYSKSGCAVLVNLVRGCRVSEVGFERCCRAQRRA